MHQRANGRPESAVKIMKTLLVKTYKEGRHPYEAMLEQRNTPRQDTGRGKVEKTDPRSADYPTDYSTDYPTDYPPRNTLNNQPNYFYGEEKHKKLTCSHMHDHN